MKEYKKSWKSKIGGEICHDWSRLPKPMSLTINEDHKSQLFIAASIDLFRGPGGRISNNQNGSLHYKIEVNGNPIIQYHLSKPREAKKNMAVNLHANTEVPAGENNIEIFYKASKNGDWDLYNYQSEQHLSVLSLPKEE